MIVLNGPCGLLDSSKAVEEFLFVCLFVCFTCVQSCLVVHSCMHTWTHTDARHIAANAFKRQQQHVKKHSNMATEAVKTAVLWL